MEDEKRICYMKQSNTVISSVVGTIIALFFVGSWIYGVFTNTSDTVASAIFMVVCGVFIYIGNKVHAKLISKQYVEWNACPALKSVLNGLSVSSWILFGLLCVSIVEYFEITTIYDHSSIRQVAIFLMLSSFSWWTYLSVAYARKSATLLLRGLLAITILYWGLPLIQNILNSTYQISSIHWESIVYIIGVSTIISVCVKGLSITFGNKWKEQFKNQTAQFILLWVVVAIFFLSLILLKSN